MEGEEPRLPDVRWIVWLGVVRCGYEVISGESGWSPMDADCRWGSGKLPNTGQPVACPSRQRDNVHQPCGSQR
jgi:hypothetical protein